VGNIVTNPPKPMDGLKFGQLTVKGFSHHSKSRVRIYECICECGNKSFVAGSHLRNGVTQRCMACSRKRYTTHGMSKTAIFKSWISMISRCRTVTDKNYAQYGGRGITVCDRWLKFENFYADMGQRPEGMQLDRIDNDKGYSPDNCRWVTPRENVLNSRRCSICNCRCRIKKYQQDYLKKGESSEAQRDPNPPEQVPASELSDPNP